MPETAAPTPRQAKVSDSDPVECELPDYLSDRPYLYRNGIAVAVIGRRPDVLFVSANGIRRKLTTPRDLTRGAICLRMSNI